MNKTELAKKINEIWEIEVSKNGVKSQVALSLQDLKFDVVKKLTIPDVVGQSEQLPSKDDVYSEIKRVTELYYNDDNARKSAFGLGFSTGVNFVNKDILK